MRGVEAMGRVWGQGVGTAMYSTGIKIRKLKSYWVCRKILRMKNFSIVNKKVKMMETSSTFMSASWKKL